MRFAFSLLPIAAALGSKFVEAGPITADSEGLTKRDPARVTRLVCDEDDNSCTASLAYDDGNWVARWRTEIHHQGLFDSPEEQMVTSMMPIPVAGLTCDGDTSKCTASLRWDDGRWIAQWNTRVFHWALFGQEFDGAMAPGPVKMLTCDGESSKCTANLAYGDGYWVAEWDASFFHF